LFRPRLHPVTANKWSYSIACADWERVLGTNVKGTAFAIKHAAKAMINAKAAGSIVNIASTSAFVAQPSFVPYSTSKGAILQITRCSALDLGKANIRCWAFLPGSLPRCMPHELPYMEFDRRQTDYLCLTRKLLLRSIVCCINMNQFFHANALLDVLR